MTNYRDFTVLISDVACRRCGEWLDLGGGMTVEEIMQFCADHECEEKK